VHNGNEACHFLRTRAEFAHLLRRAHTFDPFSSRTPGFPETDLRLQYRLHAPFQVQFDYPLETLRWVWLRIRGVDDEHLRRSMSPQPLLERPEPEMHLVQFYEADENVLTQNVGRYLLEGLKLNEGFLVIAIKEHADAFIRELERCGTDPDAAVRHKRALFLDAEETLDRCMTGDQPDWRRFEHAIGTALLEVRSREDHLGCRAYGELVALLWKRGQFSAAIRLEEFWNKLLESRNFKLFCGYPIDVFGSEFRADSVNALLCAHTHVVPAGLEGDLESAVGRAMDDVLGAEIVSVRSQMRTSFQPTAWATVPPAEAAILWIGNHVPEKADAVAARARAY